MGESENGLNGNKTNHYSYNCYNENYETSWKIISQNVLQLLNKESKTKMIFEPLYSRIYRNVCNGHSKRMLLDLISICSKHLNDINQQLCPPDDLSSQHILSVSSHLKEYLVSIKNITLIFSYLNKFYVVSHLNTDLFEQLGGLFCQIIVNHRLPVLMKIAEESLKVPFSFEPGVLQTFLNDLHLISNGEYGFKYPQLFSRYCCNILPLMKESDIEIHIAEVKEFQRKQKINETTQENHGMKRRAETEEEELGGCIVYPFVFEHSVEN